MLHSSLKGKLSPTSSNNSKKSIIMSDKDWEELDERVETTIRLCLMKNIHVNIEKLNSFSKRTLGEVRKFVSGERASLIICTFRSDSTC